MVSVASAASRIEELTIGANGAEIRRATDWISAACRRHEVPVPSAERLVLCLNEVVANVIAHGGASARSSPIVVALEVLSGRGAGEASGTVSDSGRGFAPTSAPEAPLPKTLDEAMPSGRGLRIVRRCSDSLRYRQEGGRNHFTFATRWDAADAPTASAHFHRGPDRRVADLPHATERRVGERRREALQWVALFRDADPDEVEEALAECEVLPLAAGTPLLRRGESNRNVYILLSGHLVAQLGDEDDPDTTIAIAPGECIGELSAIDGKPISALVHAVTD